jgi:mannosyl-3-phosphoglycerate phosphatase family protein
MPFPELHAISITEKSAPKKPFDEKFRANVYNSDMKSAKSSLIIFTDLDGTLIDSEYTFSNALPALNILKDRSVPLIFCSSKTQREIEVYRDRIGNTAPFIPENGGGIYIPNDYFSSGVLSDLESGRIHFDKDNGFLVLRLGALYDDLRSVILKLRNEGFRITGFGDMSTEQLMNATGLSEFEAVLAKERGFDEPFEIDRDETRTDEILERIRKAGYRVTQGRFHHILGESDKGKAVSILIDCYKRQLGNIFTVGIGDSPNDLPMLETVDYPVAVKKEDGTFDTSLDLPWIHKSDGIGPEGWNRAVLDLLSEGT